MKESKNCVLCIFNLTGLYLLWSKIWPMMSTWDGNFEPFGLSGWILAPTFFGVKLGHVEYMVRRLRTDCGPTCFGVNFGQDEQMGQRFHGIDWLIRLWPPPALESEIWHRMTQGKGESFNDLFVCWHWEDLLLVSFLSLYIVN